MIGLASAAKSAAFKAQAQNRQALVQMRKGDFKAAVGTATAALKSARQSKQTALIAMSLFRLSEAQFREGISDQAVQNASEAARSYAALAQPAGQGRALWAVAAAQSKLGHAAEANRAASEALALCRSCGDLYGAGNALNMLTFDEADLGTRLRLLNQALAAFDAAGYLERQAAITYNLGIAYSNLGLYRRARRLLLKARDVYVGTGSRAGLDTFLLIMALGEMEMGHLDAAHRYLAEADSAAGEGYQDRRFPSLRALTHGRLAILEGDQRAALRHGKLAVKLLRDDDQAAIEMNALASLGQAHLLMGSPVAALAATRRAVRLHRSHDLAALQALNPPLVWWRHSQALQANGQAAAAREALEMAYRFMQEGIRGLGDEGLRRNYLNKIEAHREIVLAWIKDARRRRLSPERRGAHLIGETSLREPFERLVDTGLRLNELRSTTELHEFLIDEATELCGAERVLLVLESPEGLRLAGSLVPRGEDAQDVLQDVAPALLQCRRTRAVSLTCRPEGASELDQRSCIIAPLIAQRELLGYLYADLDGAFGRLRESDRDLLGLLASQAAVALDNAQWSQGLEQKVAQRTEELEASKSLIEQRANELAIINSVQEGMAAELDFQAIIDLVGDKLREVFRTGDIGIRLVRRADQPCCTICTDMSTACGCTCRRERRSPGMAVDTTMRTRQPLVVPHRRPRSAALGIGAVPGTDQSRSAVVVPIIGRDRVLGFLVDGRLRAGRRLRRRRVAVAAAPLPPAWASRWRTRACSTRRSGC